MRSISELTPDYLSQALGSLVESVSATRLTEGWMADVFRVELQGAALPDTLIVKLPAADSSRREEAERFNSYGKESFFYRELAAQVPVRTPHCYYNPADYFCLILEDVGSIPASIDLLESTRILMRLHTAALDGDNLPTFEAAFTAAHVGMASLGNAYLSTQPDRAAVSILRDYCRDSLQYLPHFNALPQVLSHMDFRPGNIGRTGSGLVVIDWGEFCLAPRGLDLATLIVTTCSPATRRASEQDMITTYMEASNAAYNEVFDGYRLALLPLFYLPVLIASQGDTAASQSLCEQLFSAIEDHADFLRSVV